MNKSIINKAAARLRDQIKGKKNLRLPTILELSNQLQVPVRITRAVIEQLRKEGLLLVRRKGGITVCDSAKPEEIPIPTTIAAADALYKRLRDQIESGEHSTGNPLPKVEFIAAQEHAGKQTICNAYGRLLRDGLVYRRNRAFVVGSAPQGTERKRCALLIQFDAFRQHNSANSWWVRPFFTTFMAEAALQGIQAILSSMHKPQNATTTQIPAGFPAIRATIKSLGNKYIGCVLIPEGISSDRQSREEILRFASRLGGLGKPVVLLDYVSSVGGMNRSREMQDAYRTFVKDPPLRDLLVRCHVNNDIADAIAVDALHKAGHTVIAFPSLLASKAWIRSRKNCLREACRGYSPPIRFLSSEECPPLFRIASSTRIAEYGAILESQKPPALRRIAGYLVETHGKNKRFIDLSRIDREFIFLTAHLGAFLCVPGLSAIMAPDDRYARIYYRWLVNAGVKVPDEMTIISFDDRPEMQYPYAISSVNTGIDYLGYAAAHLLLGDVSIRVGPWRSLVSRLRINHLGTIGKVAVCGPAQARMNAG